MDEHNALVEQCARLAGIAPDYSDAFGKTSVTPVATRIGILRGFGFPADTLGEARDSLRHLEALRHGLIDPAVVVEAGHAATLALRAPLPKRAAWRLTREDGSLDEGRSASNGTASLALPALPAGYHRLSIDSDGATTEATLLAAPPRCYEPPELADGNREWGLSVQLYGLRSDRNLGIGDFTDVADMARRAGRAGASFVGLSPLHALFPADRTKYSPYSPSSRLFLEALYIDVQAIDGFATSRAARLLDDPGIAFKVAELKESGLVDYATAWAAKRPILEALWQEHRATRNPAFEQFRREQGDALTQHATFDALSEYFSAQGKRWIGDWPGEFHRPTSEAVTRFRNDNAERIAFYAWLQWLADEQLAKASRRARSSGMHIGLYRDLAVGSDRGGSEVWGNYDAYSDWLSVGAPPDPLAPQGQNWGLPALNPIALERSGLAGFRAPIRANMRHAGAIRIDHAFQLQRLFLIPRDQEASEGAYADFPFEAMLAVLRIESHRARSLVIAEDLGTAPPNFSESIGASGIYGYRVVPFERENDGSFRHGSTYDPRTLAVASTHDLPTFVGWWRGLDIDVRNSLGIFDLETAEMMRQGRLQELRQFCAALAADKLLADAEPPREPPLEAGTAFLARTNSALVCLQMEDAIGEINQANLPGIVDGHPNWRRRLSLDLNEAFAPGSWLNRLAALFAAEGRDVRRRVSTLAGPPPRATYRIQFRKEFTFDDAAAIVPYIAKLGISHLYASPILMAQPGSSHGYDVADHSRLNPELGGEEGFYRLSEALLVHGMGFLLDIVPNHMGIGGALNPAWLSLLEWGRLSPSAIMFDVDWDKRDAGGKLVVPSLGDRYGVVLKRGELKLAFDTATGGMDVWYHDTRLPICPRDFPDVLERALAAVPAADERARRALVGISERLRRLALAGTEAVEEADVLKLQLRTLVENSADVARALAAAIAGFNGTGGQPDSFAMLHRLLDKQAYRPAHWRVASSDINYRRFFDINTLAGLRAEDPAVFERTHAVTLKLVGEGRIDGLRIDHIDGLADPDGYLRTLQTAVGPAYYVLVEKILEPGETLPAWPIAGTSGYEVLNLLDSIFIDEHAADAFQRLYEKQIGKRVDYLRDLRSAKEEILAAGFSSELESLVGKLKSIAETDPMTRDFSRNALRRALSETIAFFPVYRSYVTEAGASAADIVLIEDTVAQVKTSRSHSGPAILDFIAGVLCKTSDVAAGIDGDDARAFRRLFQQLTGPVMAKSLEDTLFYRHARLISLNEVGGDPGAFGGSVAQFHAANRERQRVWPNSMIATSTHDTKRGEDARARLAALTELPQQWEIAVETWQQTTAKYRSANAPDANDCYVILQALIAAWPAELLGEATGGYDAFARRMQEYIVKALRESKRFSTWTDPDNRYEEGAHALIKEALDPGGPFIAAIRPFVRRVAFLGMLNALSRTALKYTLPGVPDTYQGSEFWDFSLVDPDNRRPVDYAALGAALAGAVDPAALTGNWENGALKQALSARLLADRAAEPDFYADATYRPIEPVGAQRSRIVAFARERDGAVLVVAVGRLMAALSAAAGSWPIGGAWGDTAIPIKAGRWRDLATGREHDFATGSAPIAELFSALPLSVLRRVA